MGSGPAKEVNNMKSNVDNIMSARKKLNDAQQNYLNTLETLAHKHFEEANSQDVILVINKMREHHEALADMALKHGEGAGALQAELEKMAALADERHKTEMAKLRSEDNYAKALKALEQAKGAEAPVDDAGKAKLAEKVRTCEATLQDTAALMKESQGEYVKKQNEWNEGKKKNLREGLVVWLQGSVELHTKEQACANEALEYALAIDAEKFDTVDHLEEVQGVDGGVITT